MCTCHDSTAVVPCTNFCSDHPIRIEVRVKQNFHRIWIAMEKPLVKRGPGQQRQMGGGWDNAAAGALHHPDAHSCIWRKIPQSQISGHSLWLVLQTYFSVPVICFWGTHFSMVRAYGGKNCCLECFKRKTHTCIDRLVLKTIVIICSPNIKFPDSDLILRRTKWHTGSNTYPLLAIFYSDRLNQSQQIFVNHLS